MRVSAPQQTKAFHLSYDGEEDRILIAVDVDPGRRYAMALTRRLAKLVLGALADLSDKRSASSAQTDPRHRDTVLNFEHASAVEAALASGDTKTHQPAKPFVQPARIVREVKLTPRDDGDIVMVFYDRNQVLTLDLPPARVHSFMAGVLDLAASAGWDLPLIAAWLDRAKSSDAAGAPRVVH
jgi:hypothetical protein